MQIVQQHQNIYGTLKQKPKHINITWNIFHVDSASLKQQCKTCKLCPEGKLQK